MLGVTGRPTQVEKMIMPPVAYDVKVISIGMFTAGNAPVVWRGPMLHRALQQFLADVFWGDLDVLLMDLPPGTGDVGDAVDLRDGVGDPAGDLVAHRAAGDGEVHPDLRDAADHRDALHHAELGDRLADLRIVHSRQGGTDGVGNGLGHGTDGT